MSVSVEPSWRQRIGEGVGGLVRRGGLPYSVSKYFSISQAVHGGGQWAMQMQQQMQAGGADGPGGLQEQRLLAAFCCL